MNYSGKELAAVVKMAVSMASADGVYADEERDIIIQELRNFGVDQIQAAQLLLRARDMEVGEAFATLGQMNTDQKQYVAGFLAAVMIADGEIDESEVKMWRLISVLAQLPTMDIAEAISFWQEN